MKKTQLLTVLICLAVITLSKAQNLILDYRFDNNWADNVSAGNDLIPYSSVSTSTALQRGVTSRSNDSSAVFFAGEGRVTTNSYFNGAWAGTAISFWTRSSTNGMMIQGAFLGFGISADGSGRLSVFFDGGTAGALMSNASTNLNDGSWHHVVAQNNGSTTSIYIDGQLNATQAEPLYLMPSPNAGAYVYLGIHANTSMRLNGKMDDVKIYDNVLTPTEILNQYNAVTEDLNLMYSYNFDGDWKDSSPAYNHLDLYNAGTNPTFEIGYTGMAGDSSVEFRSGKGLITVEPVSNVGWTETTIAFWTKSSVDGFILQGGVWGPGASVNSLGQVSVFFDGSAAGGLLSTGTTNLNDGLWHHVVAQNNGTTTYLYIDGLLDASQSENLYTLSAPDPSAFTLLGLLNNGNFLLDGRIDQVNIYNKMLTQQEIINLSSNSINAVQKLNENNMEVVLLYPNPAESVLNLGNVKDNWDFVTIHNVEGQLLLTTKLTDNKIEIGNLAAGLYFVSVLNNDGETVARQKFVKQ